MQDVHNVSRVKSRQDEREVVAIKHRCVSVPEIEWMNFFISEEKLCVAGNGTELDQSALEVVWNVGNNTCGSLEKSKSIFSRQITQVCELAHS